MLTQKKWERKEALKHFSRKKVKGGKKRNSKEILIERGK